MSIHGQNWSFPVLTPAGTRRAGPPRPQSRFAGAVDASLFTRVGPIQRRAAVQRLEEEHVGVRAVPRPVAVVLHREVEVVGEGAAALVGDDRARVRACGSSCSSGGRGSPRGRRSRPARRRFTSNAGVTKNGPANVAPPSVDADDEPLVLVRRVEVLERDVDVARRRAHRRHRELVVVARRSRRRTSRCRTARCR